MKVIASLLGILLVMLLLLGLAGGLVFLAAYGLGLGISALTDFDPFQSTLLGLASMTAAGFLATQIWNAMSISPPIQNDLEENDEDFEEDFEDEFEDDYEDEEEEDEDADLYPGIPRWRQPLKKVDFSNAKPYDRCPCGSGKLYKNCHGAGKEKK